MENIETEQFKTASHSKELDKIFEEEQDDIEDVIFDSRDFFHEFKTFCRVLRKKYSSLIREKMKKNFTNVVYLTLDCPFFTANSSREDSPLDYICELRKQYPQTDIKILIPIINLEDDFKPLKKITLDIDGKSKLLEKTSISFSFFMQNRTQEAILYKFPKDNTNIDVYGIYSSSFSTSKNVSELSRLQNLAPFIKSARIVVKKFSKEGFVPDIVHTENIPFFLGGEFENKGAYQVKVLQTIKDFTQVDIAKCEAFWASINLADKKAMKKICNDNVIKKCVATLFNLHNTKRFYQMKDCLCFIYKNYYKFRKYVDKGEDIDENIIFNRLNSRVLQLFPQMAYGEELYFNPMMYSLKRADYLATISKTYYNEIYENPKLSGKMFKVLEKRKEKSTYLTYGYNMDKFPLENTRTIYQEFNAENFREMRGKNKTLLIKEFSSDRIKTNFIDSTMFKDENYEIVGNLDSFYDAPLFFANPSNEIFANGVDILFNTVLKLFELHKNIQIIVCIKDGLKNNFVKTWVEFLSKNKYLNGRWVFIDGNINPQKFLAGSDMILIPRRANMSNVEHFLAMHYGCVPIVSRSGILNDTVIDIFDDITYGCGFKTKTTLLTDEDTNELFLSPVTKALNLYQNNPSSWNLLIKNCLNYNSNWKFKILEKYQKIYDELI